MTVGRTSAEPSDCLASVLGRVGWCTFVGLAVGGGYTVLAVPIAAWIADPVVATMAIGGIVVLAVCCGRLLRPQLLSYGPALVSSNGPSRLLGFWGWAFLSTAMAFVAGQTIALILYGQVGSAGFDRHLDVEQASGRSLVLVLTLVVAPLSEEVLFRGFAYPLLRRRVSIPAATLTTALLFACMHGNLVQVAATMPLGLVLALVAERTRGLWQVVVLHVAYNLAAMLIPPQAIQVLAMPQYVVPLAVAWMACLVGLFVQARSSGSTARLG